MSTIKDIRARFETGNRVDSSSKSDPKKEISSTQANAGSKPPVPPPHRTRATTDTPAINNQSANTSSMTKSTSFSAGSQPPSISLQNHPSIEYLLQAAKSKPPPAPPTRSASNANKVAAPSVRSAANVTKEETLRPPTQASEPSISPVKAAIQALNSSNNKAPPPSIPKKPSELQGQSSKPPVPPSRIISSHVISPNTSITSTPSNPFASQPTSPAESPKNPFASQGHSTVSSPLKPSGTPQPPLRDSIKRSGSIKSVSTESSGKSVIPKTSVNEMTARFSQIAAAKGPAPAPPTVKGVSTSQKPHLITATPPKSAEPAKTSASSSPVNLSVSNPATLSLPKSPSAPRQLSRVVENPFESELDIPYQLSELDRRVSNQKRRLDELPKIARTNVILEIVDTEIKYLRDLHLVQEVCIVVF